MSSCHLDGRTCVIARREVALGGHFGEKKQSSVERLANRGETGNDTVSRDRMCVGDVGPRGDLVDAGRVLKRDSVSYEWGFKRWPELIQ